MLPDVKVNWKFVYDIRYKKHKEIFRQTLEDNLMFIGTYIIVIVEE